MSNSSVEYSRKAKTAFGFALIFLLFLGETMVAHKQLPNEASPVVWSLLGGGALCALIVGVWFHRASRRG